MRWLVGLCFVLARPAAATDLVPAPREIQAGGAPRALGPGCAIVSDAPDADRYAMRLLRALIPGAGARTRGAAVMRIRLCAGRPPHVPEHTIPEQCYSLAIAGDSVVIRGETAAARLYAVQTLRQWALLGDGRVPAATVVDGPALRVRGVSLDMSRGRSPTLDDLRQVLDVCAAFKLNVVQLYFEDTFAYRDVPPAARRADAMTALTLRRLAAEARLRSIELIPIVETLAHQERLLSHDCMRRYAASPGMLSPAAPAARALVRSMVGDVLDASGASQVHLGCDEPAELGREASRVFADHVARLARHAKQQGAASAWIYADYVRNHPEVVTMLPRDLVLVDWDYDPDATYASLDTLAGFGLASVVTSPGLWNWMAIRPDLPRALASIERATAAARARGCLGSVLAAWGDGGGEDLFGNDVLGLAWFAEHAWRDHAAALDEFLPRYARLRFGASAPAAWVALNALATLHVPNVAHDQGMIYRPILVRPRTPAWRDGMAAIAASLTPARAALETATGCDLYADAELQALRTTVARLLAAADRERTLDGIAQRLERGDAGTQAWAAGELERLRDGEVAAHTAYVAAWRAHNLESGRPDVRARFAAQLNTLDSLKACATRGTLRPWSGRMTAAASGPDAALDGR